MFRQVEPQDAGAIAELQLPFRSLWSEILKIGNQPEINNVREAEQIKDALLQLAKGALKINFPVYRSGSGCGGCLSLRSNRIVPFRAHRVSFNVECFHNGLRNATTGFEDAFQ